MGKKRKSKDGGKKARSTTRARRKILAYLKSKSIRASGGNSNKTLLSKMERVKTVTT